jgi:hypothetical protein
LFIKNNFKIENIIYSDIKDAFTSKIVKARYYEHLSIYLDSSLRELNKGKEAVIFDFININKNITNDI